MTTEKWEKFPALFKVPVTLLGKCILHRRNAGPYCCRQNRLTKQALEGMLNDKHHYRVGNAG